MAARKIKKGQGLFESTKEELSQLEGSYTPLVSAGAASAAGANEDQAKMAGTAAHKQAAFARAAEAAPGQPETLGQADRITPQQPAAEAKAAAETAQQKADRLRQLGSLESRVDQLVGQYQQQITQQQVAPAVSADALKQFRPEADDAQLAEYTQALQDYQAGERSQADLVALAGQLGVEDLSALEGGALGGLYEGGQAALEQAAAAATPDTVTLADLDLGQLEGPDGTPLDTTQLAADLGVTEQDLLGFTPAEFQESLRDLESREFNQIQALQAEYKTASPNRQAQIMEELRQLDASGLRAQEVEAERVQAELASDLEVEFAGERRTLSDLLQDDTISDVVRMAAVDPNQLAKLRESSPALADWVEQNKQLLEDSAAELGRDVTALQGVQSEWQDLQQGMGVLADKFLPDVPGIVTEDQLAEYQQQLQEQPLYQATQQLEGFSALLQSQPELFDKLKRFDLEQLTSMKEASDLLGTDPALAAGFGLEPGAFVTSPTVAKQLKRVAPLVKDLAPGQLEALQAGGTAAMTELLGISKDPAKAKLFMKYAKDMQEYPELAGMVSSSKFLGIPKNPFEAQEVLDAYQGALKQRGVDRSTLTGFLKSGAVKSVKDLNKLQSNPGLVNDMLEVQSSRDFWSKPQSGDAITRKLFGKPVSAYQVLKAQANMPKSMRTKLQAAIRKYAPTFPADDGNWADKEVMRGLYDMVRNNLESPSQVLRKGKNQEYSDFFERAREAFTGGLQASADKAKAQKAANAAAKRKAKLAEQGARVDERKARARLQKLKAQLASTPKKILQLDKNRVRAKDVPVTNPAYVKLQKQIAELEG